MKSIGTAQRVWSSSPTYGPGPGTYEMTNHKYLVREEFAYIMYL